MYYVNWLQNIKLQIEVRSLNRVCNYTMNDCSNKVAYHSIVITSDVLNQLLPVILKDIIRLNISSIAKGCSVRMPEFLSSRHLLYNELEYYLSFKTFIKNEKIK